MSRFFQTLVRRTLVCVALTSICGSALTLVANDLRPSRTVAQGSGPESKKSPPSATSPASSTGARDKNDNENLTNDGARNDGARNDGTRKAKSPVRAESLPGVTPEREAAVTKFVERHHPELAALLASLKSSHPEEYSRAIHDLFRTSERLAQWHERDVKRYEAELRLWQAQSQIDLLTAQLRMNKSDALENQLRRAVDDQLTLRQALIKLERERVAERLKKLDEQLHSLETSRSELVERTVRMAVDPPGRTNSGKPGAGKASSAGKPTNLGKPIAGRASAGKNKAAAQGGDATSP